MLAIWRCSTCTLQSAFGTTKMQAKYIFRLDDITPTMNWENFWRVMDLFRRWRVKPLLGIVPDNEDPELVVQRPRPDFWQIMRELQRDGLADFAQHGYQHLLGTKRSEFVGLPYEVQYEKIKKGQEILEREGIHTKIWMAPAHSFDTNTLKALVNLGFYAVSDGIALYPFRRRGLIFVPQQLWRPRWFPFGTFTICLHINPPQFLRTLKEIEQFLFARPSIISFIEAVEMEITIFHKIINKIFASGWYVLYNYKKVKNKIYHKIQIQKTQVDEYE